MQEELQKIDAGRAAEAGPAGSVMKRTMDILVSGAGLIVLSPVFLAIWAAIRLEGPGKAIFSQERIGFHGKPFTLFKFRSMVPDAEHDGVPALCGETDNRLTKVGAFIRHHHLDELPQLWNVLKGDMSMVGYRPERRYFREKIKAENPEYEGLFRIRQGEFS